MRSYGSVLSGWPCEQRADSRRFELLKRAYVEARYSDQYDASTEDLEWPTARARLLRDLVANLCQARIAELKAKAATASPSLPAPSWNLIRRAAPLLSA